MIRLHFWSKIDTTKGAYLPSGTKATEDTLDTENRNLESVGSEKIADTAILGAGRMATQFKKAMNDMGQPYSTWLRSEGYFSLGGKIKNAKRIFLLIPDKMISQIVDENEGLFRGKILIHFSATHRDPRILGFHPLGTFNKDQQIDFSKVNFHGIHPESIFREAIPFLKNPYTQLSEEKMQTYHALCVMAGNFSAILWKAFFKEMKKLGVSEAAAQSYFEMFAANVARNPETAVTGPLVRNDIPTLEKNMEALKDKKELHEIYQSFVQIFSPKSEYLK